MAHVKEAGFYKRRLSLCGAGVVGVPVFGVCTSRIDVFALSNYKRIAATSILTQSSASGVGLAEFCWYGVAYRVYVLVNYCWEV